MSRSKQRLCHLADIPEGFSRGFSVLTERGQEEVFLVRKDSRVLAYRNSCPHTGAPLDWLPDQFLNVNGDLIQCATHDALFRIEDGTCIAGPCVGRTLSPVSVAVSDEGVYLLLDSPGARCGYR